MTSKYKQIYADCILLLFYSIKPEISYGVNREIVVKALTEYAVPVIESLNRIIKEEETEYQGIISQIHASLQSKDLYTKPYELII